MADLRLVHGVVLLMRIPPQEAGHLCAVSLDIILDLSDRGVLTEQACESFRSRLAHWEDLFKDLPRFGKAFDAFLLLDESVDRTVHQYCLEELYSQGLPIFGIAFIDSLTFSDPAKLDPRLVIALRDISYLIYKYEAPYDQALVQKSIDTFVQIDEAIVPIDIDLSADAALFERLFRGIDLGDITPCHGPGSVADKAIGDQKYDWSTFPECLSNIYSYDYFVASPGHLSEALDHLRSLPDVNPSARLLTVPKDSRGPRVISCEPKELQWIQQGIRAKLYTWIERHPLTRGRVRFTDQSVNGDLAIAGSLTREWATLDLSEASDRVGLWYVERTIPRDVLDYMLACRSHATQLPNGSVLQLKKFAPMGSALCFPVLALTIFARLFTAGITRCHVYGDDVIVPRTQVPLAITALEAIGLKVNRSKSCTTGLFRESCGVDAFKGVNVTPVRLRTRWASRPHPSMLVSWISYANSLHDHGYVRAAERVAAELVKAFGPLPQTDGKVLNVPCFTFLTAGLPQPRTRWSRSLHTVETYCLLARPKLTQFNHNGYYQLLNWFSRVPYRDSDPVKLLGAVVAGSADSRSIARKGLTTSWYTRRSDVSYKRQWVNVYEVDKNQKAL